MQSQNRLFDDLARLASGAYGAVAGMKSEVEARLKEQLERVLADMDLVRREEFEAVKAMASKARSEQEDLERRLALLEARFEKGSPAREEAPGTAAAAGSPESGAG
jgi:BMFP domain-containing protein YqiC